MKELRTITRNLFLCLFSACGLCGFAQIDKLNRATQLLQARTPDLAVPVIDSVVLHPETKNDFVSWTTRGYIYYEIYKKTDKFRLNSSLRDTIISSIKKSNSLKPDEVSLANNKRLLSGLANQYYNIAKVLLQDSLNDTRSAKAYNKCKELSLIAKPDTNFAMRDVEYYVAVGSVFSNIFNNDNKNTKAHDIAKLAHLKVFDIDPDNAPANMNMGLMYLNQGINLVKSLDYGADLSQIDAIQENIVKLAKQSEQFILKVYKKDNKNPKAVQALYYIYRMLNDAAKQAEYQKKAKDLNIKLD
ncbi:MAG: hypothetical protein HYX39_04950 [Bacteroidetes bacterium]|nr:hypothetical protein [Bacteroidota bacterium]